MGFFGGSTTYVSSTLYNMAGDELHRSSYLKTTIIGAVVGSDNDSIADTLQQSYIAGPAIKLRSYFHWALNHYEQVGVPHGNLGSAITVDAAVVASQIPGSTGHTVQVQRVRSGIMDYSFWAEQWMMDHHPELLDTNWGSDISDVTNEITILFADNTTVTFTPVLDREARYIYAIYSLVDDSTHDWGTAKMFIYKLGSGNSILDGAVNATADDGEYVPFIPLRLDNKFLSNTYLPAGYVEAKKAYRRALGSKSNGYDKMITKLKNNPNLSEIDYAYVMFGVPLNVHGVESREYLFRFFDKCRGSQSASQGEYNSAEAARADYETKIATWQAWKIAQAEPPTVPPDPLYGTPEPVRPVQSALPGSEVLIKADGSVPSNVNMKIRWGAITKTTGTGIKDPTNGLGTITIKTIAGLTPAHGGILSNNKIISVSQLASSMIEITWQKSLLHWETLTISGLVHENLIYNKKAVVIGANEALADIDDSGFLVPLHMATVREMRLVSSTQMMSAGAYVVLNSYKVVKKKWYETGFFKLIVFAAIIGITVATGGATAVGLLGTAGAVGAAVGLTGLAAVIAGTVINALAAMILSKLLTVAGTAIFGAKFGAIFAAVVGTLAMSVSAGLNAGLNINEILNKLSSVQNLMNITSSVSNGVAGFIQGQAQETLAKTEALMAASKKQLDDLTHRYAMEFGYGRAKIDPLSLTDRPLGNYQESEADFLSRTLLTGSEIAQMSIDMVTDYPRYSLTLPYHR